MTLIEIIQVSEKQEMAIYQLSDEAKQKYGKSYLLSSNPYSDYAMKKFDEDYFIKKLREYYYEGLFETRLEAFLTARIVEANAQLSRVQIMFNDFKNIRVHEVDINDGNE